MKKENYEECRRLKRESKYLVEYAMMLVKSWSYYQSSHDMNFLDAVVRVLGSKNDYERFNSYRTRSDSMLYEKKMKNRAMVIASE